VINIRDVEIWKRMVAAFSQWLFD